MSEPGIRGPTPVHFYGGIEHAKPGPYPDCLLCTLEAVAAAWFDWKQDNLDELLGPYRKDEREGDK